MPPKNKFTKDQILEAAFEISNDEGFDNITIRKVADKLGSSPAPIYVNFKNLDELKASLTQKVAQMATDVMLSVKTHDPFLDIGAGNIRLAMDYPMLFTDFHLNPNFKKCLVMDGGKHQALLIEKMSQSTKLKGFTKKQMADVLQTMAYITYGLIFDILQGKNDASYEEMIDYMEDAAEDVIAGYKIRKGV